MGARAQYSQNQDHGTAGPESTAGLQRGYDLTEIKNSGSGTQPQLCPQCRLSVSYRINMKEIIE